MKKPLHLKFLCWSFNRFAWNHLFMSFMA